MDLTGLGSVSEFAKGVMDRFFPKKMDEGERAIALTNLTNVLETRESSVRKDQKDIIVAEMNQGDNYTKRARPTIVYFGLVAIGLNHVVLPWVERLAMIFMEKQLNLPPIALPEEFWYTWGGVCSIWIWGRSKEKMGAKNKIVSMITGS
jgi:hypothetical protein